MLDVLPRSDTSLAGTAEGSAVIGTLTVRNQREAIELERAMRRHVFAWLATLDVFDRPTLAHPRLRALEQAVREAEYAEQWAAVEQGWTAWRRAVGEVGR